MGSCHGAIDYGIATGTEVIAAADGQVGKIVSSFPKNKKKPKSYGNYIRVEHANGFTSIYAHLLPIKIVVKEGEKVVAGQILGLADNTGQSTGPHLHFEVRDPSGKKVNPYGENPKYPNCGKNALWVTCPPEPVPVDNDGDGFLSGTDCNDANPAVNPNAKEFCDGVDNDCDSATDEKWKKGAQNDLGKPCTAGFGACVETGTWQCAANGIMVTCGAPAPQSTPELCDGIDNDCDGKTDEEWPLLKKACTVGKGACANDGAWMCAPNGAGIVCSADATLPSAEVCDGLDNDCDGKVDEKWPELGGPCANGTPGCAPEGVWICAQPFLDEPFCDAPATSEEVCADGVDNDCDGLIDEACPCSTCCADCYAVCVKRATCIVELVAPDEYDTVMSFCYTESGCAEIAAYKCTQCMCKYSCTELYNSWDYCPGSCTLL